MHNIAALIVTYNRKDLLKETIEAILNQTLKPNRLFVVNNASTDGTDDVLNKYKEKYGDDIEIINLKENLGGAGGFNYGIHYIYDTFEYDWIWLMDDDAVPAKNALETLFTYYDTLPKKKQNKIGVLQNKRVLDREWFDKNNGNYFPVFGSYIYHPTWTTQLDYIFKKKEIKIPGWKIYYVFRNPFLMYRNNEVIKFFLKLYFKLDALMWKRIDSNRLQLISFCNKRDERRIERNWRKSCYAWAKRNKRVVKICSLIFL
ncbi:MAG: hypothetical protein B6I29_00735 [Marinitoga sp. 4572_148]|nr:MAG: hypothetical protein B6I29_00735 [Marinitoga sp. 4572_148]